jgi:hypothetical protein
MGLYTKASAQQRKQWPELRDSLQNEISSFPTIHLIRDLYPKHIKNSKNETPKEQIIQSINGQMNWTDSFHKK